MCTKNAVERYRGYNKSKAWNFSKKRFLERSLVWLSKNKSVLTAIDRVLRKADKMREDSIKAKDFSSMILLYIKNASNNLPWWKMLT